MPEATGYDEEFARDEDDSEGVPKERLEQIDALNSMARRCEDLVQQSIRDRNNTGFSDDVRRAYKLYNATVVTGQELQQDFEGNRRAVADGSKVVNNLIRQVTNDGASQLGDMLYPNDDDNYGLEPIYPSKPPLKLQDQPAVDSKGQPLVDDEGNPVTHLRAWEARRVGVEAKCRRMFQKIDGTLDRIKFGNIGRTSLLNAAITGTCVIKGPFVDPKGYRKWIPQKDGQWDLSEDTQERPTYAAVNVLDFLPDLSAENPEEMAYASVRVRSLGRDLEALLELPQHYESDQVKKLLAHKPEEIADGTAERDYERKMIKDSAVVEDPHRYELFETWASFSRKQLEEAGVKVPQKWNKRQTLIVCVTHCFGITLSVHVAQQQHCLPFSMWWWDRDPLSLFGRGVPVLGEAQQLTINAGWRMILDHGGVSAVPMVTMLKNKVESADPNDKSMAIRGGKVWNIKGDFHGLAENQSQVRPFEVHDIPIHLDQFFAIMDRAEEDMYKVTGVTRVDKNEAGQGVDNAPITFGATQIFQNNASVSRRRQVRDFDDHITATVIGRLYDWFMARESDDDIKVALTVEPKGSSVLMQREVNTQNVMQLYTMTQGGTTPGSKGESMLRALETGMQYPAGKFIETEEETLQRKQLEAENPPVDPAIQIEELKLQQEQAKTEVAREKNEAEIELKFLAQQFDQQMDQARFQLETIKAERDHIRESERLGLLEQTEASRQYVALQSSQDRLVAQIEAMRSQRDIEAAKLLQKESAEGSHAESEAMSATARILEAETHRRELDHKLAGDIEEGV